MYHVIPTVLAIYWLTKAKIWDELFTDDKGYIQKDKNCFTLSNVPIAYLAYKKTVDDVVDEITLTGSLLDGLRIVATRDYPSVQCHMPTEVRLIQKWLDIVVL